MGAHKAQKNEKIRMKKYKNDKIKSPAEKQSAGLFFALPALENAGEFRSLRAATKGSAF